MYKTILVPIMCMSLIAGCRLDFLSQDESHPEEEQTEEFEHIPAIVSFVDSNYSVNEADGEVAISLKLEKSNPDGETTIRVKLEYQTASQQDVNLPDELIVTFPAGESTKDLVFSINDDELYEGIEPEQLKLVFDTSEDFTPGESAEVVIEIFDNEVSLHVITEDTKPAPQAEDVNTTGTFIIRVMEALDPTSINSNTFQLLPPSPKNLDANEDGQEEETFGLKYDPIPTNAEYDIENSIIKLRPRYNLDAGTRYTVHAKNLKLKNGFTVSNNPQILPYSFSTTRSHEFYRIKHDELGQIKEERFTDIINHQTATRRQYEIQAGVRLLEYLRHYPTGTPMPGMPAGDILAYWQQDGTSSGIQRYEVKRQAEDGKEYAVRVRYMPPYPQSADINTDPIINIWTNEESVSPGYLAKFQYEPTADNSSPISWPANGQIVGNPDFTLDDAHLLNQIRPGDSSNTQQRHIYYGELGNNGQIDFNTYGQPEPVDDIVRIYHTRALGNSLRTHEWSWMGEDRFGNKAYGEDGQLFTDDDVAYRVRIYIYDDRGRTVQRVTYETPRSVRSSEPYGLTRSQWKQVIFQSGYKGHRASDYKDRFKMVTPVFFPPYSIDSGPVPVNVHSYRVYEYEADDMSSQNSSVPIFKSGSLRKLTTWHENSDKTGLYLDQFRYYSSLADIDAQELATALGMIP